VATTEEPEKARRRLAALRESFAKRIQTRATELGAAIAEARAGEAQGLERALSFAHRLAGTAGSYGWVAAGEAASELHRALDAAQHGGGWSAVDEAWQRFLGAVDTGG
jgi:hypothetical protein